MAGPAAAAPSGAGQGGCPRSPAPSTPSSAAGTGPRSREPGRRRPTHPCPRHRRSRKVSSLISFVPDTRRPAPGGQVFAQDLLQEGGQREAVVDGGMLDTADQLWREVDVELLLTLFSHGPS